VKSIVAERFLTSIALTIDAAKAKMLNIRTAARITFCRRGIWRSHKMKAGTIVSVMSQSEFNALWTYPMIVSTSET